VLNAFKPWLSCKDIDAGARWPEEVGKRLESARAGIVCLTPANLHEDWILFEAGALAKTVSKTYVCPLLIGLESTQVKFPLAEFQAKKLDREGIWDIIMTFRKALTPDDAMNDSHVAEVFEDVWPRLEKAFSNLPSEDKPPPPSRSPDEMTAEILELVRGFTRSKPANTVLEWEGGIVDGVMKVANKVGLDVRSAWHGGIIHGHYVIDIATADRKTYTVRIPVDTPTTEFQDLVTSQLSAKIGNGGLGVQREMVSDGSDFLNSKT